MFETRPHATLGNRLWSKLNVFGAYAPLAMLFLIGLPMLSLSRIGLMLWQSGRVAATGIWPEMLIQGVRVDIIQLSLLALPLILLAPVLATGLTWRFWRRLSAFWIILSIALLALLEVSSPAFITEYDS
ncbi:MAG: LTA synthase family protein, partial [Propionivibrio sp.]|nr:LTA synthase family protein [Propionivibrio sp.]